MTLALGFAWRRLRRSWRAGELRVLALAVAVAVAATSGVGLFTDRLAQALQNQTGEALGADAFVSSRKDLGADYPQAVADTGLRTALQILLPSVVFFGEQSTLAAIKAVPENYPLRNVLRIADQPYGDERVVAQGPPPDQAWVDARLWAALSLQPGAVIRVGAAELPVTGVLTYEPDRGGGFVDLAPRVLINEQTLLQTQLLVPGARAQYVLQMAGSPAQLAAAEQLEMPSGARWVTPAEARPAVQNTLERAGRFLALAVLASSLLAAAAIALAASQHGQKLQDEVALLKSLGATGGQIVGSMALGLMLLGLLAGLLGLLAGGLIQWGLVALLGALLQIELPWPGIVPLISGLGLGLLLLVGFGLPPVLAARGTPPIRIFQRAVGSSSGSRLTVICALVASGALLWWQAGDVRLAGFVAAGALLLMAVLGLLAWLGVRLLAPLRRTGNTALRYGLGNIARRGRGTIGQAVALGIALMALLLLAVARGDLLEAWRDRLPEQTPNQFLINIQPDQVDGIRAFLDRHQLDTARLWPMARGRLVRLRGEPVTADSFEDPEAQRWVNRDFNLSWAETLGPDNRLIEGELWAPDAYGRAELSADDYAKERLNLELGDTLSIQFADQVVQFTVTSFRVVSWDSFQPNFFLVTMPGVLDQGIPASWLTSFYLPSEQRPILRELVQEFPNVTALDLDAIMQQVRAIVERVVRAVEFVLLFAVLAGLTVLLAAIEGTRAQRLQEVGLLRTLGATRRTVAAGLMTEYALLGALAGGVGAVAAQAVAWVLAEQVFEVPFGLKPWLLMTGLLAGSGLVAALGWFSLRRVVDTPPAQVLRGSA